MDRERVEPTISQLLASCPVHRHRGIRKYRAGGQGWTLPLVFFLASKAPPWTRRPEDQKPEDDQGGFAFVRNKSFVFQKYIFHHAVGPLLRFSFHCQVPLSARISSVMGNICCWSKDYHRREKSNRHIEVTNVDSEKVRDCHA